MTIARLLRLAAIAIAILGIVDPVITAERIVTPTVAVIDTGPRAQGPGPKSATRPAGSSLGPWPWAVGLPYRFVSGPSLDAAATIVIGNRLPAFAESIGAPAFVLASDPSNQQIAIRRVTAPARARFESRVPIDVAVETHGLAGRHLTVRLDGGGLLHDRVERNIDRDGLVEIPLTFVPAAHGLAHLRVSAGVGVGDTAIADTAVHVDDRRWSVLFFDRRPSWTSTFVRRALEQDARFDVGSRVVTSTGAVTVSGQAPDHLRDVAPLGRYDAIVIGAPDALTKDDVNGLEAFARRRGGAVVLLLEQPQAGLADALTGVARWQETRVAEPLAIEPRFAGLAPLQATEILTPAAADVGRDALATITSAAPSSLSNPTPLWQSPLGAGRLIVSGLVDAWRYRGVPESSAFDAFFRFAIGRAADASPPAIEVRLGEAVITPGESVPVEVTLRDAVLAGADAAPGTIAVEAGFAGAGVSAPVRLWPEPGLGRFRGLLRAPESPGAYLVTVTAGTDRGMAPIIVIDQVTRADDTSPALLAAWATTRGGRVLPAGDTRALEAALASAIPPIRRPARIHPFRSAWWIVAFAGALGGEWWLRRRRNLK